MHPYELRQPAFAAHITVSAEGVWQGGVNRNGSAAIWSCIQVLLSVITVAELIMDYTPTVLPISAGLLDASLKEASL